MIHCLNSASYSADSIGITADTFAKYLHSFECQQRIINKFKLQFGQVEILESHGHEYFKIRIPKDNKTLGFMFGFIESNMDDSWGVKEYSTCQTTLEMIFNKFAEEGS